ncbi:type 2 lanthipeptide synthetase LanM family protein [Streptomyces capoamus]|uniref:type 2 lanthipeptide synthetase LanM family protein n=1 Tax=Streptomyces capoamus TaxID=68183 RepID=UPI00339675DC
MTANDALAAAGPAATPGSFPGLAPTQSQEPRDRDAAEFVEAALAGAPGDPVAPVGPLPGTAGFAVVLAPLAELAGRRLLAALAPDVGRTSERDALIGEFTETTAAALGGMAARALVLELQAARLQGRLAGATPQARFRDFVAVTGTRAGLVRLFAAYPLLTQLVGRHCVNAVAAMAELLNRYAEDRAELVARLLAGRDPGPLVAVDRAAGDAHRRGRRVAVLRFADTRRVVYKPRPLAADRHFAELVDWCNARAQTPGLRTPALLTRPDHGWSELIEARPCASRAELDLFYRRLGVLLALAHALDLTDLHHENLIACADHPVLVDLETLFHPPLPEDPADDDPAGRALDASVQRIGLLPQLVLGDGDALDLSGLGGGADRRSPVETAGWEAAGTDAMRLVRRPGAFRPGANRPRLAGVEAEPAAHTEALVAGFRAGYRTLTTHRHELSGLLRRFADDEVRVVTRATQVYVTVLAEATHPDALRDPGDRAALLRLLGTDAVDDQGWPGLLDHEIAELWDGDVPVFTARPGRTDLWSGTGARIPGALDRSGLDRVAVRLASMDEADLAAQERIIRTALACRTATPAHPAAVPGPRPAETGAPDVGQVRSGEWAVGQGEPRERAAGQVESGARAAGELGWGARAAGEVEPGEWAAGPGGPDGQAVGHAAGQTGSPATGRLLGAARELGDLLVRQAHRGRGRANWLGVELLGERYRRLGPCGADLGHGYSGVALFLAQLAALTGADRYAGTARDALRPLPRLLDRLAALPDEDLGTVGSGGFAGLGGILYALTRVSTVLDDAELRALVEPAAALTVRAAGAERAVGLLDGTAGGLAALLAAHRTYPSAGLRRGAAACADRLAGEPVPAAPGFATGAAGVGWALLGFAASGGGEQYRRAGLAALRSAVALSPAAGADLSWCNGASGVALAVADRSAAMADPALSAAVATTVGHLADAGPVPDGSLCHGEWGLLELPHRTAAGAVLRARAAGAVRHGRLPEAGGSTAPGPLTTPGLLTGLAGHGLGLLRLGFPGPVPPPLLLRVPDPEPVPPRLLAGAVAVHGSGTPGAGLRAT